MRINILALFVVCCLGFGAFATTSVDPSRIAVGARSLAMGRVSAADPGNINSLFINPANAAALPDWGVTSMYTSLLEGDMNYQLLGGAKTLFGGTVGLAYLGGGSSGLAVTSLDASGRVVPTGTTFDYANSTITLAYGRPLNNKFSAGGSLKLISKSFGSQGSGSGYGLDLGLLFNAREDYTLGLTVQNALSSLSWGTGATENTPLGVKGGVNFRPRDNLVVAADADLTPLALHAGAEWQLSPLLALRGGLERVPTGNSTAAFNFMAGLGLALKGINFDYAYIMDGTLAANSTHYFTLGFIPAAVPAVKAVEPTPPPPPPVVVPPPPPPPAKTILVPVPVKPAAVKKVLKKAPPPKKKPPVKKAPPKKKRKR